MIISLKNFRRSSFGVSVFSDDEYINFTNSEKDSIDIDSNYFTIQKDTEKYIIDNKSNLDYHCFINIFLHTFGIKQINNNYSNSFIGYNEVSSPNMNKPDEFFITIVDKENRYNVFDFASPRLIKINLYSCDYFKRKMENNIDFFNEVTKIRKKILMAELKRK